MKRGFKKLFSGRKKKIAETHSLSEPSYSVATSRKASSTSDDPHYAAPSKLELKNERHEKELLAETTSINDASTGLTSGSDTSQFISKETTPATVELSMNDNIRKSSSMANSTTNGIIDTYGDASSNGVLTLIDTLTLMPHLHPATRKSSMGSTMSDASGHGFDDAPYVVRSYNTIPLLEQTKLPRGGISMETEAVGRVQVCPSLRKLFVTLLYD